MKKQKRNSAGSLKPKQSRPSESLGRHSHLSEEGSRLSKSLCSRDHLLPPLSPKRDLILPISLKRDFVKGPLQFCNSRLS
ncbi:hypothetical protein DEO72_LG1g2908 [Vigna unguiculata]|uniref:Uncharacterized protein n=1 Tax=Vigna unguiculata TaxID=3917 RepID=A0A4D6KVH0_VIGUN|nr:hypothetical protein DEO72_LG1g2908 [Vigna unguiculata]